MHTIYMYMHVYVHIHCTITADSAIATSMVNITTNITMSTGSHYTILIVFRLRMYNVHVQ